MSPSSRHHNHWRARIGHGKAARSDVVPSFGAVRLAAEGAGGARLVGASGLNEKAPPEIGGEWSKIIRVDRFIEAIHAVVTIHGQECRRAHFGLASGEVGIQETGAERRRPFERIRPSTI